MFIDGHDKSGQYVFTYGDGDDFEEPEVVAITALEDEFYFYSRDIDEEEMPLRALNSTRYGEDLPDYVEKRDVPQGTLEIMEDNQPFEEMLEEDSHDPVDVERKLDLLAQGDAVKDPTDRHTV